MPGCNVVVLCHDLAVAVALYRASLRCCGVPVLCLTPLLQGSHAVPGSIAARFLYHVSFHRGGVPVLCLAASQWGSCAMPRTVAVGSCAMPRTIAVGSLRRALLHVAVGFLCRASPCRSGGPAPRSMMGFMGHTSLHLSGVLGPCLDPAQWGSSGVPHSITGFLGRIPLQG